MQISASNQFQAMAGGGTDAPDPERRPKEKDSDSFAPSFRTADTVTISSEARLMAGGGTDAPDPERRPKE